MYYKDYVIVRITSNVFMDSNGIKNKEDFEASINGMSNSDIVIKKLQTQFDIKLDVFEDGLRQVYKQIELGNVQLAYNKDEPQEYYFSFLSFEYGLAFFDYNRILESLTDFCKFSVHGLLDVNGNEVDIGDKIRVFIPGVKYSVGSEEQVKTVETISLLGCTWEDGLIFTVLKVVDKGDVEIKEHVFKGQVFKLRKDWVFCDDVLLTADKVVLNNK